VNFRSLTPVIYVAIVCLPSMATAFCSEPRFSVMGSFEDQINDRIQYLLCLHNSQVDVLNQHARSIDAIREEIRVFLHSPSNPLISLS
jgi:hypothetical protein